MQFPSWARDELDSLCARDLPPSAQTLVVQDGFDVLEKEAARGFFAGLNWQRLQS